MRPRAKPEAPNPEARKRQIAHELDALVAAGRDVRGHPLLAELSERAPVMAARLAAGRSAYVDPFNPEDTP
jgi:hypothetical protein